MSEATTKQLTVIISFLNEGIEVARTVESVRQYAAEQVDILVINDASNHLYDYAYMNMARRSYSCKASVRNQCVISYDGAVYKCSGRDFTTEHQDGVLSPDGNIHWNQPKLDKRLSIVTYDNDLCRKCKFLPLCWGPCCQKQLETTPNDFRRFCQKQNMELNIADYMRYRFNNAYISNSFNQ
ncbi:MAG: SPASM domain-containing protein [Bacteroides sp.]|nr:SPASM domain-containing protein [Bacteroides sp.]